MRLPREGSRRESLPRRVNTGALRDHRWHHFAKVWRTPLVGELFTAVSRKAFLTRVLGLENPRRRRSADHG